MICCRFRFVIKAQLVALALCWWEGLWGCGRAKCLIDSSLIWQETETLRHADARAMLVWVLIELKEGQGERAWM